MVSFINFFFLPAVALRLRWKRTGRHLAFSADALVSYCSWTVGVLLLTKAFTLFAGAVLSCEITPDSVKYTLVSLAAAVILPFAVEFVEKYVGAKVTIEKSEEK